MFSTRPAGNRRTLSLDAKLAFWLVALCSACSSEVPTAPSDPVSSATVADGTGIGDLTVVSSTPSTVTLGWTEVSDGRGAPAAYSVRYAAPPLDWTTAKKGCAPEIAGVSVGSLITCTVEGLVGDMEYDFQVLSRRSSGGGHRFSNVVTARTPQPPPPELPVTSGIWIGPAEIAQLSTTSEAWANVLAAADASCGTVDLADQFQSTNVCVFAKALVFARTGATTHRDEVVAAIAQIVASGTYVGRALALGHELGTYVVAADLVDLRTFDPALDELFRAKLRELRTTPTLAPDPLSLVECNEKRPNNWGAYCGATRAAIAVYLGDTLDLARTAQVLEGYLGNRAAYAGFVFGGPPDDLSWQCDPTHPVGINPAGCGDLDGVLPDDQRRAGSYAWPPPQENHVWAALQGLIAQAVILHRAGYPVWEWQDRALLRAMQWLHDRNGYPARGDDTWIPHIINRQYGTSFPAPLARYPGKNYGFSDWTHGGEGTAS
jgi:hypothetical protein